jgi:hypothetical protein
MLRFRPDDWDASQALFAEAELTVTVPGAQIDEIQTHTSPNGCIEIRGRTSADNLDGLTVEFGVVSVVDAEWASLDIAAPDTRSEIREGVFEVGVTDAGKRSVSVDFEVDRRRPLPETDPLWLISAIDGRDADGFRLVSGCVACNHRGGAAEYERTDKRDLVYPLKLRFPVPTKVERSRRGVTFDNLPLPE